MVSSRGFLACAGISSVLGQDLFMAVKDQGTRRRRTAPSDSSYLVALRSCGIVDVFQQWTFDPDTSLIQMRHSEFSWEQYCLGADEAGQPIVTMCSESSPLQQWTQQPNSAGGHQWKNNGNEMCLTLDTSDDDSEAVVLGFCNEVAEAGWFEEVDALPLNMLRTVVQADEADGTGSKQRKCLSAIVQDGLPGPAPEFQDNSVCQHVATGLPDVSIPMLGPLDAPLGIKITLENFTLQIPELVGNFLSCGLYDEAPGGLVTRKGKMSLDMDIPEIPFKASFFHFERPPAHGSGRVDGSVHAVITVKLDYDLANPDLTCSDFDITIPDMKLDISGGGGWELLLDAVTGAIKAIVKGAVPKALNPKVCPVLNRETAVVSQCSDTAAGGLLPFVECVFKGPVCTTAPCYSCDNELGSCSEVPVNTTRSTTSIDSCSQNCVAPSPPPPACLDDGQCTDGGDATQCCTGRINRHGLFGCKYGECGCLAKGVCVLLENKNDCCSQSAHRDLLCDALLGHTCN